MECTITVLGAVAMLKDWHWTSSDKKVEDQLNSMLGDYPGPEDPQPEINEATKIADRFGGRVLIETPYISVPGRVY